MRLNTRVNFFQTVCEGVTNNHQSLMGLSPEIDCPYEKLSNLFIALSHHENIGLPNGVTSMKIPKNICKNFWLMTKQVNFGSWK